MACTGTAASPEAPGEAAEVFRFPAGDSPMLTVAWRTQLDPAEREELEALVAASAGYDAEQGFSVIDLDDVLADLDPDAPPRLLTLRFHPEDQAVREKVGDDRLAAIARAVPLAGGGHRLQYTVDPAMRSLGITTLFVEEAGLPGTGATLWEQAGIDDVEIWARGTHPAAVRMARRFDIRAADVVWRVFRLLDEPLPEDDSSFELERPEAPSADLVGLAGLAGEGVDEEKLRSDIERDDKLVLAVVHGGVPRALAVLDLTPVFDIEIGRWVDVDYYATADGSSGVAGRLLAGAVEALRGRDLHSVIIHIDPADDILVSLTRRLLFVQERTDVLYAVPARPPSPSVLAAEKAQAKTMSAAVPRVTVRDRRG